jgi:hypothetical protein
MSTAAGRCGLDAVTKYASFHLRMKSMFSAANSAFCLIVGTRFLLIAKAICGSEVRIVYWFGQRVRGHLSRVIVDLVLL